MHDALAGPVGIPTLLLRTLSSFRGSVAGAAWLYTCQYHVSVNDALLFR